MKNLKKVFNFNILGKNIFSRQKNMYNMFSVSVFEANFQNKFLYKNFCESNSNNKSLQKKLEVVYEKFNTTISLIDQKLKNGNLQPQDLKSLQDLINSYDNELFWQTSKEILQPQIENLLITIFETQLLNEGNITKFLPVIIEICYLLNLQNNAIWEPIAHYYSFNVEKFELEQHLFLLERILSIFVENEERQNTFKKFFFDMSMCFEQLDYLKLDFKNIILFVNMFFEYFTQHHQELIDDIQNLLTNSYKNKLISDDMSILTVTLYRLSKNPNINIDFMVENFMNDIYKNIKLTKPKNILYLLVVYKRFIEYNQCTKINPLYKKIQKMTRSCEEDLINYLDKFSLDELIELLQCFSNFEVGSLNFYEEIEKIIGKNIEKINPGIYLYLLDGFAKTGKFREKFMVLMQRKVLENKDYININDICKILRIFASVFSSNVTIFEKLHDYVILLKENINDNELADLIFAYSLPNISNNNIFNEFETIIDQKLQIWKEKRNFALIIDILRSYTKMNKGNEIIQKMKNIILTANINKDEIDDLSTLKLFKIFEILKLNYNEIRTFDPILKSKLKYYNQAELVELKAMLTNFDYQNKKTLEIIDKLIKMNNNEKEIKEYLTSVDLY